jgi:hypothetical protein
MRQKNFVRTPQGKELSFLCLELGYKLADRVSDLTRHQINFLISAHNYRAEMMALMAKLQKEEGMTGWVFM